MSDSLTHPHTPLGSPAQQATDEDTTKRVLEDAPEDPPSKRMREEMPDFAPDVETKDESAPVARVAGDPSGAGGAGGASGAKPTLDNCDRVILMIINKEGVMVGTRWAAPFSDGVKAVLAYSMSRAGRSANSRVFDIPCSVSIDEAKESAAELVTDFHDGPTFDQYMELYEHRLRYDHLGDRKSLVEELNDNSGKKLVMIVYAN